MGQTKRKRRTKHRGTAAGTIEARGRTGKHSAGSVAAKKGAAGQPVRKIGPPTWGKALAKSFFGAILIFALAKFGVLGKEASTTGALSLAAFAIVAYTPIMFITDRFQWQRYLRKNPGAAP
jgi:hypothetical protein